MWSCALPLFGVNITFVCTLVAMATATILIFFNLRWIFLQSFMKFDERRFQWKWIFTGSKTCCTILRPFRFAMAAILNPKWSPKCKNPPIWAKFGFQVDYDVANWYSNLLY
jgi:hypothetical protein